MNGTIIHEYAKLADPGIGKTEPSEVAFQIYQAALDTAAGNTAELGGLQETIAGGDKEALSKNAGNILIASAIHLGALEIKAGLIRAAEIIAESIERD